MTDEEMAKEYANENKRIYGSDEYADITDYNNVKEAFLAGLKTGRETENEYVKNNAFTSMKEQGLFPIDKWHKVADGDLPKDDRIVSDQEGNNVRYVKHRNMWFYRHMSCEADVIAWCELPKYMEK